MHHARTLTTLFPCSTPVLENCSPYIVHLIYHAKWQGVGWLDLAVHSCNPRTSEVPGFNVAGCPTTTELFVRAIDMHWYPLLEQLHWLPVRQHIDLKLAILTYKIRHTSTPAYLSYHIRPRESTHHLCSSTTPLLHRLTTRTHFADRTFRCSAPAVWHSLNTDTLCCSSLALLKRSLKTFLFRQTFRPSSSCIARL